MLAVSEDHYYRKGYFYTWKRSVSSKGKVPLYHTILHF